MTEEQDIVTPAYYIVNRKLTDEQLGVVQHAFKITPIACVLITSVYDNDLALKLHESVSRVEHLADAHALAQQVYKETGQAVAIIGDAVLFDSFDGKGNLLVW
jgi:hypothetical protein